MNIRKIVDKFFTGFNSSVFQVFESISDWQEQNMKKMKIYKCKEGQLKKQLFFLKGVFAKN